MVKKHVNSIIKSLVSRTIGQESERMINYVKDPLYRNSFFIVISNLFNMACGFFFWMIAARHYSIEDLGISTAIISSLGLVVLFSRLGFDISLIRFFPDSDKHKAFSTSLVITSIASLIVGAAYIVCIEILSQPLAFLREPAYAAAFLLIALVNSIASISGFAFLASRRADHYLYQNGIMSLRIPLLIPLAFLGSLGILLSMGLSYLVASAVALMLLARQLSGLSIAIEWELIRKSLKFSSLNYLSSILATSPTLILPILVLNLLGKAETANYFISTAIANLVLIVPTALSTSLLVEASNGEDLMRSVTRATYAIFIVMVPLVLIIYVFGSLFLGLLKAEYVAALDLLRILVLSSFLVAVYSLFMSIQNIRMRPESIVRLNLIRCLLLLGLSYLFMTRFGIIGAGYAWILTYIVIAIEIARIAKREKWIKKCSI